MTSTPPTATKPPSPPKVNKPPVSPKAHKPGPAVRTRKTFTVAAWDGSKSGETIVIYGKSGIGKNSLARLAPKPVFVGFDPGGKKILRPDGTPVDYIPEVRTVDDLLDLLSQPRVFDPFETLVIDNATKLEEIAEPYVCANYQKAKGGRAQHFRDFGWDGAPHMLDVFRKILAACDPIVEAGKNIVWLAQAGHKTVENPEGADYLEAGPSLIHQKHASVRDQMCQWADHVFRIGYLDVKVDAAKDATVGKVSSTDMTRAVYTGGAMHYIAKSRPIRGLHLPPVISFDSPDDDTLWRGIADPSIFTTEE